MDRSEHGVDVKSVEFIPLQSSYRSSSRGNVEAVDNSSDEEELNPESDAADLRRHHAHAANTPGGTLTSSGVPHTVFGRLLAFIMSKNPLLLRSSPALDTGSYGAIPLPHSRQSSSSTQASDDGLDDVRRRDKRKASQTSGSTRPTEASTGAQSFAHEQGSRNGRTLSQLSESAAAEMQSKTPHAGAGRLPQMFLEELGGGHSDVSSAASDTDRSSKSNRRSDGEEDAVDNSPYPQVRASVPATDDTTLSISTPRMWTLALLFALAGSATNLFFSLRYPSVAITPVIALVLVHPLGKLWDLLLKWHDDPKETFIDGIRQRPWSDSYSFQHRFRLWLAQGKWNEKEHACVYISSNVSFGFAFATDVIVEQHKFYKQDVPILYQILLTISTQILGYSFAGLTRRYLVRPAAMVWPGTLMSTAMFTTMHKQENEPANGWTISRYRFFVYVWLGAFAWYFLPGLLFPALSYFSVVTWFAPKNVVVANLVGLLASHECLRLIDSVWRCVWSWTVSHDL
jgi:OPT oligopeptide transporter protein